MSSPRAAAQVVASNIKTIADRNTLFAFEKNPETPTVPVDAAGCQEAESLPYNDAAVAFKTSVASDPVFNSPYSGGA